MNIELVLYLIDIVANINVAIGLILGLLIIIFIIIGIISLSQWSDTYNKTEWKETSLYKSKSYFLFGFFIIIPLMCLIPSQKTMYMIVGANVIKSSTIPSKVEQAINKKLDEYLTEEKKDK